MEADVCIDHLPVSTSSNESVNIREFEDAIVNPDPVIRNEDTEQLMEDFLSPQKLKNLTGIQDLHEVVFLEMIVNTLQNSLGNFGSMVQNLKQLKLTNSIISSVRDLGTSLTNLQTLWMAKCGLAELDGISSLCSIQELYLAYNDITEVSPLTMLDNLQVLDLEGNLVEDIAQVEFLVLCPELKRLTLEGNPVCMKPRPDSSPLTQLDYNYRVEVHKALPKLTFLDDEPFLFDLVDGTKVLKLTPSQQHDVSLREKLKSDWELVTERIKAFDVDETITESKKPGNERPSTSHRIRQRPSSARPGSSRQRPGTSSGERPGSGGVTRPSTAAIGEPTSYEEDDSSDLTHGSAAVICGNPSRALKSRRKNMSHEVNILQLSSIDEENHDGDKSQRDLFEELKTWRNEYARILDSRPQSTTQGNGEDDTDGQPQKLYNNHPAPAPSNLSPTPPQYPVSSPLSNGPTRRRISPFIRASHPLPSPPEDCERPRTAPSFPQRQKSSRSQFRTRNISGEIRESQDVHSSEPRANSAPVNSSAPQRSSSSTHDASGDLRDNPVISASRELERPRVDRRTRVRPSTARPAAVRKQNLQ
ncbi:leucine-rich repeat-containing protein 56-like [Dendronephthya gigantea]|uniref:leucine-rich repeat-containing protein 56-like n=1 Tax=Dendronephthya gigantea TaxID=151771 RepID=UPI00106997E1|nr:leucine-rich repeat-containing protein 56-like [Dendronephthya gigantea]